VRFTEVKACHATLVVTLSLLAGAWAQDPGKKEIGQVRTELIFGTSGSVAGLGRVTPLGDTEQSQLRKVAKLAKFKTFVTVGSVKQSILAGYKSWASPIKNSEAIMVTFQPQARVVDKKLRLDIEYWQKKKMALRWDRVFEVGKIVYLIGPEWRDGNLIIKVELVDLKDK